MMTFFAVDIGASSGRTILGRLDGGRLAIEELTRFSNPLVEVTGHCYWDILGLHESILEGLCKAARSGERIEAIGIDTWGVDFVAVDAAGQLVGAPYAYRDPHTAGAPEAFFAEAMPREALYKATGTQIMNFNTLFQLYTLRKSGATSLAAADKLLFMPDALAWLLTGEMVTEYTIASTSQMIDPFKRTFAPAILQSVGLSGAHFARMVQPGTLIGTLSQAVQRRTGLGAVPVVAVAGHDTASAVAAVPAEGKHFAYLSSGTWSLMGVELPEPVVDERTYRLNVTNEGGVEGTIRLLKNICGMWLLEQCRREWDAGLSYGELIAMARAAEPFAFLVDPDDERFATPTLMSRAIADYLEATGQGRPTEIGKLVRCIFESLALRYKEVAGMLGELAPFPIERLHVIGGGSKNNLLNQFTANALGISVVAGPSEATAIGNLLMQARAMGAVGSLDELRAVVRASVATDEFTPQDSDIWNQAYDKYNRIIKR